MKAAVAEAPAQGFAERLLAWQREHGRHDLPWQQARTPYRVWLSEIMLQQTQVATVIPYFERFAAAFPDVAALAAADIDEVLHLWSGLGYYSRARNLHRAAQMVCETFRGVFPDTQAELERLPGIGRSTAGAILALAHDRPVAILDGNVKRVLARYHAVPGWPGESAVLKRLWALSEAAVPGQNARDYTQAIMDLGATLCTRTRPACERCPLAGDCTAHASGRQREFPGPRPKREIPTRRTCFLVIDDGTGRVLLERRPPRGVWGGLWCFPEAASEAATAARLLELGIEAEPADGSLEPLTHTFTHFRLEIAPLAFRALKPPDSVRDGDGLRWYSAHDSTKIGLSAPVEKLLGALADR